MRDPSSAGRRGGGSRTGDTPPETRCTELPGDNTIRYLVGLAELRSARETPGTRSTLDEGVVQGFLLARTSVTPL
ncbi:MAG: hypothetical protein AB2705_22185 [Candidatus Thiodiazotropha sp.]